MTGTGPVPGGRLWIGGRADPRPPGPPAGPLAVALAVVVATAAPTGGEGATAMVRESGPRTEALAFIRVIADVRVDFGGVREPMERKGVELATGSGFVAAPSGLVLTSQHVVAVDDPGELTRAVDGGRVDIENRRIEVVIGDDGERRVFDAWVAAGEAELDLAALQVTASDLPYLPMGDSDAAEPGRPVQVFGFPFGRQVEVARGGAAMPSATVTAGSLSATREDDEGDRRYLQTDAVVNPGSSGGPMVDEDGYVVGLVRMKLSTGAAGSGPGFAVSVNVVKDFLEAHGLIGQLPVGRLRTGVLQSYDWKGVRLEAPDGFRDSARSRLRLDLGEIEGIDARVFRVATALPADELDGALLRGDVPGFVPGPATPRARGGEAARQGVAVRLGSGEGETNDARPFRVEYAVLSRKDEAIVARYLGSPEAIAFNLGLVRRSLRSLEAAQLRGSLATGPEAPLSVARAWDLPSGGFAAAALPDGAGADVPLPAGWTVEPADESEWRSCLGDPPSAGGLAARHPRDYAVVLRAWRLEAGMADALQRALAGCRRGFQRLGIGYASSDRIVRRQGADVLLLELEAPESSSPLLEGALDRWAEAVAPARR